MPLIGKQNVFKALDNKKVEANNKCRRAIMVTFRNVIKGTPVGNPDLWLYNHPTRGYIDYVGYFGRPDYVGGRARNNWFLTTDKPSLKTREKHKGDGGDAATVISGMPSDIMNKTIYLTNNMPYIVALEYGHSSQAPEGWVRSEVIKLKSKIRQL